MARRIPQTLLEQHAAVGRAQKPNFAQQHATVGRAQKPNFARAPSVQNFRGEAVTPPRKPNIPFPENYSRSIRR